MDKATQNAAVAQISTKADPATPTASASAKNAPMSRAKLSRRAVIKLAIAGVVLCVLVAYLARNLVLGTPVATNAIIATALQQTVVASGRIATPQRLSVASVNA